MGKVATACVANCKSVQDRVGNVLIRRKHISLRQKGTRTLGILGQSHHRGGGTVGHETKEVIEGSSEGACRRESPDEEVLLVATAFPAVPFTSPAPVRAPWKRGVCL